MMPSRCIGDSFLSVVDVWFGSEEVEVPDYISLGCQKRWRHNIYLIDSVLINAITKSLALCRAWFIIISFATRLYALFIQDLLGFYGRFRFNVL